MGLAGAGAGAGALQLFRTMQQPEELVQAARAPMAADAEVFEATKEVGAGAIQTLVGPNIALWFLYGAVFAIIVFIVVDWIISKRR